MRAARRREIDAVLVWRLDRWGRSLVDLITTLKELSALGVGFVSITEALDLTTPSGRLAEDKCGSSPTSPSSRVSGTSGSDWKTLNRNVAEVKHHSPETG